MVDNRDEFTTTNTTTKRDEYATRKPGYIANRGSGSMMWTLILGGLIALGLIFAFSTWDSTPDGPQTSMTDQQQPAPAPAPAVEPAPAPAPAPSGGGTGTNP